MQGGKSWSFLLKYHSAPKSGKLSFRMQQKHKRHIFGVSTSRRRHQARVALHCLALPCYQAQAARLLRECRCYQA